MEPLPVNNGEIIVTDTESHGKRTKVGIAAARKRGVEWGTHGSALASQNKQGALTFAEHLRPTLFKLMVSGVRGPTALARELNKQGVPTRRSGRWHPVTVHRLLKLLGPSLLTDVEAEAAIKTAQAKVETLAELHKLLKQAGLKKKE